MPRRRPSFATYARRRWRVLGILLVLLLGSLLVLAITDRGHDPRWEAKGAAMPQGALSPHGDVVYDLVREDGNVTRLEARRGVNGHPLWSVSLPLSSRALLVASEEGAAVATDFPQAFLTVLGPEDGRVLAQVPLEGVPRAMSMEGTRVALALQAPQNPVLVVERDRVLATHRFGSFVNAVELRGGRLAVGTVTGEVRLADAVNGTSLYNGSFGVSVRSLRLAEDGGSLVFGGAALSPGDLSGGVAFVDLLSEQPVRWSITTGSAVGYVDLDRSGLWALAVEDGPSGDVLHAYEAYSGVERWQHGIDGGLAQGDANEGGGVALSSDGQVIAVGTLHGGLSAYRMLDGAKLWSYHVEGTTRVRFADAAPGALLVNGRHGSGQSQLGLLLFDTAEEPLAGRLPALAAIITAGLALAGALILGIGYWRLRRSY